MISTHHPMCVEIDMIDERFGMLVVVGLHGVTSNHNKKWMCLCDCGSNSVVFQHNLKNGKTRSCGCLASALVSAAKEKAAKERRTYTKKSYQAMIARCTDRRSPSWEYYGERGISVCDRWLVGDGKKSGWECFYEDMGARAEGKSIDRINNDLGYELSNCRWATHKEQAANRRPRKTNTTPPT